MNLKLVVILIVALVVIVGIVVVIPHGDDKKPTGLGISIGAPPVASKPYNILDYPTPKP